MLGRCAGGGRLGWLRRAMAHPLGNFTINQLAQVRIDEGEARVHYVLDQAEIPTFQQLQRYDADGSGGDRGQPSGEVLDACWARSLRAWR